MTVVAPNPVITFVEGRIDTVLRTPEGWGGLHEAELQVLLALDVLAVASGRPERVEGLNQRYTVYLHGACPSSAGPLPLAHRVALTGRIAEFSVILRAFVRQEMDALRDTL